MKSNARLEKRYFLSEAVAYFSGVLILAPIVHQNIGEHGFTVSNDSAIAVVVLLILTSIILCYSACFRRPNPIMELAKIVTSKWGSIPLLFFTFTWIMNLAKMVTQQMSYWQIALLSAIGSILIVVTLVFIWSSADNEKAV